MAEEKEKSELDALLDDLLAPRYMMTQEVKKDDASAMVYRNHDHVGEAFTLPSASEDNDDDDDYDDDDDEDWD